MADLSALKGPSPTSDAVATPEPPKTIGGLPIHRANENPDQYLKTMFYGPSGVGKSVLAASADAVPEMRKVLYCSAEAGTLSVAKFYPSVEVVPIQQYMDFQKIFDFLRKGGHGYKTVVLDSLTENHRQSMDKIMDDVVKKDSERDKEVPSQREWGKSGEQIRKLVRLFRDLPMHVIFVALEAEQGGEGSPKIIGPSLPGKLLREVPGYVDVVGRLYVKEKLVGQNKELTRYLLTKATATSIAKDRTDGLDNPLESPTMAKIYESFVKAINSNTNSNKN